MRRALLAGGCLVTCLSLGGCASVSPKEIQATELADIVRVDRAAMREGVEPLDHPLTIEEAQARAVKYNLDRRTRLFEEALAFRQNDLSRLDMLPELLAQTGYVSRNNDRVSRSRDADDPDGSLVPSRFISQERNHLISELTVSWSLLDLGLGSLRAGQQANRALIAREQRRRALHLLLQDVRIAFWKVASRQRMAQDVQQTIKLAEDALANARRIEASRIRNPAEILRYQRQLLENMRLLEAIQQELAGAEVELAQLANLPVGQPLTVAEPASWSVDETLLREPVERLEEAALLHNPDGLEQAYAVRNARLEGREMLLGLLPNLSVGLGLNNDDDRYLVNNNWLEASSQVSFNLLKLLSIGRVDRVKDAKLALATQRRVATNAATIAKVHLARLQLVNARAQMLRADEIYGTDSRYADVVRKREVALFQNKLDRVSADTAALLSLLRRYQAVADLQAAEARLAVTLGVEPEIPGADSVKLSEMIRIMSQPPRQLP